ncbi:MAG TPA: GAF domain-containing protein [Candidatus Krumholzibacteria bacterium]|nr:GAF domain-containing protein [Candidatus Krumholzibacteria bacterium]
MPSHPDTRLAPEILADFQGTIDLMARIVGMPVGLLNLLEGDELRVAVSADHPDNPIEPGLRMPLNAPGVFCQKVISTGGMVHIPDALHENPWADVPDFRPGMLSYLGFPVRLPDGEVIGTLCVLDSRPHALDADCIALVERMRDLAERHLELWWLNRSLGDSGRNLVDYRSEIDALRRMVPICSSCKRVREDEGFWRAVDAYFGEHAGVEFTHGICPDCEQRLYGDLAREGRG